MLSVAMCLILAGPMSSISILGADGGCDAAQDTVKLVANNLPPLLLSLELSRTSTL